MSRELWEIAKEIKHDWCSIRGSAKVYVDEMERLQYIKDAYYYESGEFQSIILSMIRRFLINSSPWSGKKAEKIKAELRDIVGWRNGQQNY